MRAVLVTTLTVLGLVLVASQHQEELDAQESLETDNAIDAILDLFDAYPLVALAEGHAMQELSALYESILRHPEFPTRAGMVVVEFGSGGHQGVIDRYVSGGQVSYDELSHVWRDLVGAGPRATTQSIPRFFAVVRAINQQRPASERIRVLAGQAPFDFDSDYSPADLFPVMINRDEFFARVVIDEVLSQNRKALIIAGGFHLDRTPPPAANLGPRTLMQIIEERHPGSAYVLQTHDGFFEDACNDAIESLFADTDLPVAAAIKGTALESLLTEPGCEPILPIISPADVGNGRAIGGDFRFSPGPGDVTGPDRNAPLTLPGGIEFDTYSGPRPDDQPYWADGYLYLGARDTLTLSPLDPMLYLDLAYFEEQRRRFEIMTRGRFELEWEDLLEPEPNDYAERFFRPRPQ